METEPPRGGDNDLQRKPRMHHARTLHNSLKTILLCAIVCGLPPLVARADDADQQLACRLELVKLLEPGDAGYREGFQNYKLRFGAGDWKGAKIIESTAWGNEVKDLWGYFNGGEVHYSDIEKSSDGYGFVYSLKSDGSSKWISAMFRFTRADGAAGVAQTQFPYAGENRPASQGTPPAAESKPAAASLKLRSTLKGHPGLVYCVQFTADGKLLVSSSAFSFRPNQPSAETVIVWSVADAKKKTVIPMDRSVMLFGLTEKQLAIGQSESVGLFDLKTGRETGKLPGPGMVSPVCVTASEKGSLVAAGFQNNDILLWSARGKKVTSKALKGHTAVPIALAFSPDSKQLVSGGSDNAARLWDVATGKSQHVLKPEGADSPVVVVRYSHDGRTVATAGNTVHFWDPATGVEKQVIPFEQLYGTRSLAFSPDGSLLATTSVDLEDYKRGKITLWDLKSAKKLGEVSDADGLVYDVAFSPDGKLLAAGGGETVKLWTVVRDESP
jgi:WD40 repeat protein